MYAVYTSAPAPVLSYTDLVLKQMLRLTAVLPEETAETMQAYVMTNQSVKNVVEMLDAFGKQNEPSRQRSPGSDELFNQASIGSVCRVAVQIRSAVKL